MQLAVGAGGGRVNGDEPATVGREEEEGEWMKKQEVLSHDGTPSQASGWANQMPRETERKKKDARWQKLSEGLEFCFGNNVPKRRNETLTCSLCVFVSLYIHT